MNSTLKHVMKIIAYKLLSNKIRISYRLHKFTKHDYVVILNLHRVAADDGSAYAPLDPILFRKLLEFCSKSFFITTFNELRTLGQVTKPKLILSFDDGYKDFIEVVVPILDEFKIKVNQNIIPMSIISGLPPLNVMVQDFIGKAPSELLNKLDIPGLSREDLVGDRIKVGMKASLFIKTRPMAQQLKLREYLLPQLQNLSNLKFTLMMSEQDIRQLIEIHEFGAHSYEHANIGLESDDYFLTDLTNCQKYFAEKFAKPVNIYAFPNGSYRPEQLKIALEYGYEHLLLVDDNFANSSDYVYKRFTFYASSIDELKFRATGNLIKI